MRDWNLRVLLRRLWRDQRRHYASWAVQLRPDPIELRFWTKRGLDVLDADLDDYVKEVGARVAALSVEARDEPRRARARTRVGRDVRPASPYKGLVPFDDSETDAVLFFGRETEREIISREPEGHRLTVLYGPSGVGKSSVLRAGVVHHLRQRGRVEHPQVRRARSSPPSTSPSWPGDPRAGLAAAVADEVGRLTGEPFEPSAGLQLADVLAESTEQLDGTLYVVLDQMEEYFLYHGHGTGEGSFTRELAGALAAADLPVAF